MSEKWKTEFFEWKDEIEAKFNNLSQKNIELEKKFDKKIQEDMEEWTQLFEWKKEFEGLFHKDWKDLIKEQIAGLHKQVNNNATEVDTRFSISETVLQDFMEVIRTYACEEISECIPELQDKLKSYPVQNRIDRLDAGLKILKKHEESLEESLKQVEKKEIIEDSEVLKDIKELAQKESDFYDKHGYFSFWSDKLKAQRIKDFGGEKDVSEVDETGGATPTRNVELDTSSLLGDDSNPLELNLSGLKCPICLEKYRKDEIEFECPYCKCEMYVEELSKPKEKAEPNKELYELYLKDKGECYFKKITHPFTEYNNMVHRGMGMKLMPYDTEEKLIEEFLSKKILIPFIAKIIEKETNEEYCSSEIIAELIFDKLKEKWQGG